MDLSQIFSNQIVVVILIIAITFVIHNFSSMFINLVVKNIVDKHDYKTHSAREKRHNTLYRIFNGVFGLLLWLTSIAVILGVFSVDISKIATGAGFLGIIIGLGAQATIRDIVAGTFILVENQYRIGDIVTLSGGSLSGDTSGVVEDVTLRITKLRDLDGVLHTVRNGEASVITNRTYEYSRVVIDIGVAYDSDINKVEKVINKVGLEMKEDVSINQSIREPIKFLRVDKFADSAIVLKVIGDVEPAEQWTISGEFRRRIIVEFRKNNIEIAFPQIVVHKAKTDK